MVCIEISRGWCGRAVLALLALFAWEAAWAIPVEANIKGDSVNWVSAQTAFNGGVAPSVWATPPQLVPAHSFIPGASALASLPLSMVGPSGSTVPLVMQLLGMEYNSPEAIGIGAVSGGGSASVSLSGGLVQVQGQGLGDQSILLQHEVTPFTHARPIFSLGSSASIVQAFLNANAAPGTYTSQVSIPLSYDYERAGVRIRYNWTLPVTLIINYSPSILNDVTLTSPTAGIMTPRYYKSGGVQYASGDAIYQGVATGFFSNGLRVRLKTGDSYLMTGPEGTTIPLSVSCMQCDQPQLVHQGTMVLPDLNTTGTHIAGDNVPTINFTIGIQFSDVPLTTLQTGTYQGFFSLLLEPDM
jgi:hypothetical protein